jgi:hypothetical protein
MERHNAYLKTSIMTSMVAATALVLTGCGAGSSASSTGSPAAAAGKGSSSTDAATYRTSLEAQCAAGTAFNRDLPALAASQHLTQDQILAKTKQHGVQVLSEMARTMPPPELMKAHQKLIADFTRLQAAGAGAMSAATLTAEAQAATALMGDFETVGASGCAANERQAIKFLEGASRTLSATPTPTSS